MIRALLALAWALTHTRELARAFEQIGADYTGAVRVLAVPETEPTPRGVGTRVQLGTRVRIELPDEPDALAIAAPDLPCGGRLIGHLPEFDGRTGTVIECAGGFPCRYGMRLGHGYVVAYDRPLEYFGFQLWAGHYALSELREVESVTPPEA